jgi:class 3 adenylate cyclase
MNINLFDINSELDENALKERGSNNLLLDKDISLLAYNNRFILSKGSNIYENHINSSLIFIPFHFTIHLHPECVLSWVDIIIKFPNEIKILDIAPQKIWQEITEMNITYNGGRCLGINSSIITHKVIHIEQSLANIYFPNIIGTGLESNIVRWTFDYVKQISLLNNSLWILLNYPNFISQFKIEVIIKAKIIHTKWGIIPLIKKVYLENKHIIYNDELERNKPFVPNKIMNSHVQQALDHLQNANYAGYFTEMDKVVPPNLKTPYQEHKGKFIGGQYPFNFYQQLEIFAREVQNQLDNFVHAIITSPTQQAMETTQKTLYIIFADLKGYGSNAGNNSLLAKVTDFFFALKDKHFYDGKEYFFKAIGDGILATGHNLVDMATKALTLRDEIKNHNWIGDGFAQNLNVRIAVHTGETFEHYYVDNTIREVSGTAIIQAARLEPYAMVGEVFCSQVFVELLSQQHKSHNLVTLPLGKYNLGKPHDKFEMDISVLLRSTDKETYEEYKVEKCKKHLAEKTQTAQVEPSEVAKSYDKATVLKNEDVTPLINSNNNKEWDTNDLFEQIDNGDIDAVLEVFKQNKDVFSGYQPFRDEYLYDKPKGVDFEHYKKRLKTFINSKLK